MQIIGLNTATGLGSMTFSDGLPQLVTTLVREITTTTATSGGIISNSGGSSVTARGVCWDTNPNPTTALATKTSDGTGLGEFVSAITSLTAGNTYYVRAYATNSYTTVYGNELSFTVSLNYATWNSGDKSANVSLDGTLLTASRNGGVGSVRGTIGMSSLVKPHWEIKMVSTNSTYDVFMGVANSTQALTTAPGNPGTDGWAFAADGGDYYHNGFVGVASGTWPASTNDVFGFSYDGPNGALYIRRNGTLMIPAGGISGDPMFTGITGTMYPIVFVQFDNTVVTANFGASAMQYSTPAGFLTGIYT